MSNTDEPVGASTSIMNDKRINYDSYTTLTTDADIVPAHSQCTETDDSMQKGCSQRHNTLLRNKPTGNLEVYESMFETWREQEVKMEENSKDLSKMLATKTEKYEDTESKVEDREKSITLLQAAIKSLHNDLNLMDNLCTENAELKSKITTLTEQNNNSKRKCDQLELEYENRIKEMRQQHATDIDNLKMTMNQNLIDKQEEIGAIIKEKETKIQELKTEIETTIKEKESEVAKLTVDYENKFAKIQRQKTIASMTQQQTSSNQEIFRKKLHHLKMEYERETTSLKQNLLSAQTQLTTLQQREKQVNGPPMSKKMRKF